MYNRPRAGGEGVEVKGELAAYLRFPLIHGKADFLESVTDP